MQTPSILAFLCLLLRSFRAWHIIRHLVYFRSLERNSMPYNQIVPQTMQSYFATSPIPTHLQYVF
nr:MAG TPA: hypothetical protein [Caudoviricetes sp.]